MEENMKIAIVTSPFGELPPAALGAVEKLFYLLAGEWVKAGCRVTFVCCGGGADARLDYVRLKKYKRTGSTKKDLVWDFLYSAKALWKCPKADILLCNTFWTPVLAPLFRWKYKKLIYGVHRYPKGQFWLYPCVHAFICVSTAVADELRRQLGSGKRVFVISNPIDTNIFHKCWVLSTQRQTFTIVYAGRVHPEKGLDILFEAAQLLQNQIGDVRVVLKIIGTIDVKKGGGGESYVKRLAQLAPAVAVSWQGEMTDAKMLADCMRKGDCFVYPSIAQKGESFGVAPFEAMALGLPTLLSNLKCFADYVEPGVNAIQINMEGNAAVNLKEALRYVWEHSEKMNPLADCAAKTALRFSQEKIAREYVDCFRRVLREGGCE